MRISRKDVERFLSRVEIQDSHWIYRGYGTGKDRCYPVIGINGGYVKAYRFAYMLWIGPLSKSLEVDHVCRNTFCVNPEHLEAVTTKTNIRRARGWTQVNSKWYCKHGHLVEGHNLYVQPSNGRESCRECGRLKTAANNARYRNNRIF